MYDFFLKSENFRRQNFLIFVSASRKRQYTNSNLPDL